MRLSPGFFTQHRTGEVTSRLSSDLVLLHSVLNTWMSEFTRQIIFLVGGVLLLTITDPTLTLTTIAVAPIVVGVAFVFARLLLRARAVVQDRVAEVTVLADETF